MTPLVVLFTLGLGLLAMTMSEVDVTSYWVLMIPIGAFGLVWWLDL